MTAATYLSGGAAPVRAGLTLVKDARKVGRLGEGLTRWAGRSAREMVDVPKLRNAVATGSLARPGQTAGAIKVAIRAEKASGLVRLAKDVGRIGEKAGTWGELDTLKGRRMSRAPHGLRKPKAARPVPSSRFSGAERYCSPRARSISRCGYLARYSRCSVFCPSIKATTERLTLSWLQRSKAKRLRRQSAA